MITFEKEDQLNDFMAKLPINKSRPSVITYTDTGIILDETNFTPFELAEIRRLAVKAGYREV